MEMKDELSYIDVMQLSYTSPFKQLLISADKAMEPDAL